MDYVIDKAKVHEIMKEKGISTQQELADILGITKNQLSVMLSVKANPFKSTYNKLCAALNVSPLDIITEINRDKVKEKKVEKEIEYIDIQGIKAKRDYTSVELFAGAGGLALGLEMAGFHVQGLVEIDKFATKTLSMNRPNWNVIEEDIVKVATEGMRKYLSKELEIDFISGGYPCQAFSYAGHKLGLEDVR